MTSSLMGHRARGKAAAETLSTPRRDAIPKHAFIAVVGARLCGRCGMSAINPVHRHDPYEHGPLVGR